MINPKLGAEIARRSKTASKPRKLLVPAKSKAPQQADRPAIEDNNPVVLPVLPAGRCH